MAIRRSTDNKIIAGVAGGLAESLNTDPKYVRIGFALFTIFGGAGIALYLLLWLVIPRAEGTSIVEEEIRKAKGPRRRRGSGR